MYVPADGPPDADLMVVGEAPAREEVRQGKGFVGPSGRLLWPLLGRQGIHRASCRVTNLSHHPLDNDVSGDLKMTEEQFKSCQNSLRDEVFACRPKKILAVGTLAAKALLWDRFTNMKACNGASFWLLHHDIDCYIYPTWHPAAALRGGGEDKLAWTYAAIQAFASGVPVPEPQVPPEQIECTDVPYNCPIGVDTEGTPKDPICLTWAADGVRSIVWPEQVPEWWQSVLANHTVCVYHNAPWDWAVMESMGVNYPHRGLFADTMELAYLRQTEPQALKDLAWRHLRYRMRSWEDVVMPYWDAAITARAVEVIERGTEWATHSPKTGKPYKNPRKVMTDGAKALNRALKNPKLLGKRLRANEPSLRFVPEEVLADYATCDAWATLEVWKQWQ